MMDVEERMFVVTCKIKGMKCEKIRDNFERKFHKKCPTDKAIRELLTKFQRTGSVHDDRRNGRRRKSGERMELVREAYEEDPQLSTRRASYILEIPRPSIHRIPRSDLKKKNPYHIQVFHSLQEDDYPRSVAMCAELIDQTESANLINKMFFGVEATFHTCGKVNRHNCCIWVDEKPPNFLEWERDTPKVNVWLGMTQSKVYGPFFFAEATVTGPVYLDMLEQFLQPHLLTDGILDKVVFQKDGAPCHYAITVRDYLDRHFPGR